MNAMRCEVLLGCLLLASSAVVACREAPAPPPEERAAVADVAPPWAPKASLPTPPLGMAWIEGGALVAGTPPDQLPRIADEEMPGEQVVLGGFFMDIFAYPNEEGAIPKTGVTHEQAASLCAARGKRLCTELEWERACKGPQNTTYEYGSRYRADVCLTGRTPRMLPSGYRAACRSEFGVRDMHGSVWEWTSSRWGRGTPAVLFSVRGGNAVEGELVGRCANAIGRAPETTSGQIGFRCCKGEPNGAEVSLHIERGPPLDYQGKGGRERTRALDALLPDNVRRTLAGYGPWRIMSLWEWHPIGNVELLVGGGCAGFSPSRRCGVIVARLTGGEGELMVWVWAGHYPPAVRVSSDPRRLWVYGGDRMSHFRQPVLFEWGRVRVADVERNLRPSAD